MRGGHVEVLDLEGVFYIMVIHLGMLKDKRKKLMTKKKLIHRKRNVEICSCVHYFRLTSSRSVFYSSLLQNAKRKLGVRRGEVGLGDILEVVVEGQDRREGVGQVVRDRQEEVIAYWEQAMAAKVRKPHQSEVVWVDDCHPVKSKQNVTHFLKVKPNRSLFSPVQAMGQKLNNSMNVKPGEKPRMKLAKGRQKSKEAETGPEDRKVVSDTDVVCLDDFEPKKVKHKKEESSKLKDTSRTGQGKLYSGGNDPVTGHPLKPGTVGPQPERTFVRYGRLDYKHVRCDKASIDNYHMDEVGDFQNCGTRGHSFRK